MNFLEVFVGHFATNTANFSISTLVLQKQHSFKHKRQFSQVHKHKNKLKHFTHKFSATTRVKCRKNASHDTQAYRKYH